MSNLCSYIYEYEVRDQNVGLYVEHLLLVLYQPNVRNYNFYVQHFACNYQKSFYRNKHEEVILLLTMAEYMARKEAILSQAPEFFGMRSTKFRDAIIAYDLTAIALSRVRSFRLVIKRKSCLFD